MRAIPPSMRPFHMTANRRMTFVQKQILQEIFREISPGILAKNYENVDKLVIKCALRRSS